MSSYDSFFSGIPSNSSGYSLTDAWVVSGGNYINLEFSRNFVPSCVTAGVGSTCDITEPHWASVISDIQFVSSSGNIICEVVHVSHEYRISANTTVVVLKLKTPRIVSRSESIFLPNIIGNIAQDESKNRSVTYSGGNRLIRNYSSVDQVGGISFGLRSGSSPYIKKSDPLLANGRVFRLSDSDVFNGSIEGEGVTVLSTRGFVTEIPSDPLFNGLKSFSTNNNWIGKLNSFSGAGSSFTWYAVVNIPEESDFSYSVVSETGGSQNGNLDEFTREPAPQLKFIVTNNNSFNSGSGVNYALSNKWTISSITNSHRFQWGSPTGVSPTGKISNRTLCIAIRSNGTEIWTHTFAGNILNVVNQSASNQTLSASEYYALRSAGNVKFSEFIHINRFVSDIEVKEHLSFLDDKYATKQSEFYVDPTLGSNLNNGTSSGTPFAGITTAISNCLAGAGDRIYLKNGEQFNLSSKIFPRVTPTSLAPLGYSPDYPFVISTYGSRALGRPILNYTGNVSHYIESNQAGENIAISGIHLKSNQRNILNGSFVGQQAMKAYENGFGIQFKPSVFSLVNSNSLFVSDCEIQNALRSGVSIIGQTSGVLSGGKYSSVLKTYFHDCYNAKYPSTNQEHSGSTGAYGVSGIYVEGVSGFYSGDNTFFRVGWSPHLVVDSGITSATGTYNSTTNTIVSPALAGGFVQGYQSWQGASSSQSHNIQRVQFQSINGNPSDFFAFVSSGINVNPNTGEFGISLKAANFNSVPPGSTVVFSILDPMPKTVGNSNIIFGGSNAGPFIVSNNIFIDSSGYDVISSPSLYQSDCVSESNQFGTLTSSDYTKLSGNFYSSSCSDTFSAIVRKSPGGVNGSILTIGKNQVIDRSAVRNSFIQTPPDTGLVNLEIFNNIFSGSSQAEPNFNFPNKKASAGIFFDKNLVNNARSQVRKNTFYSMHGTAIGYYTQDKSNSNLSVQMNRNIIDQVANYDFEYFYAFQDPYFNIDSTAWNSGFINFGGTANRNIYSKQDSPTTPQTTDFASGIRFSIFNPADVSFNQWASFVFSDSSAEWTNIIYQDESRNLSVYTGSLGIGTTCAIDFATNAISNSNTNGWNSLYSASEVLDFIRAGWTPTSLNQADYGGDYVGAVPFNFTPPAAEFLPFLVNNYTYFGYGRG